MGGEKVAAIFSFLCISTLAILFFLNGAIVYAARFGLKLFVLSGYIYLGVRFRILTKQNFKILWNIVTFKKDGISL